MLGEWVNEGTWLVFITFIFTATLWKDIIIPLNQWRWTILRVCVCARACALSHVCVCVCVYSGVGGKHQDTRKISLLLQHCEILINLIPLYDQRTVLLAENMTTLYGCNQKITAMSTGPENEAGWQCRQNSLTPCLSASVSLLFVSSWCQWWAPLQIGGNRSQ